MFSSLYTYNDYDDEFLRRNYVNNYLNKNKYIII